MNTPICDFVRQYASGSATRLHMPGHKGVSLLGMEELDITEIDGADSLYEASGIIAESERNAGELFGCATYYSTEGSSQCIRAMLHLAMLHAGKAGRERLVFAARNVHKTFLSAAALLDFDVEWLFSSEEDSYLSCLITGEELERRLRETDRKPAAVYVTSPDYLGNTADISSLAEVCHRYDVLLLVDNAHGAYLRFLPESMHPIDLGADICCDSAHKTLPVLTGGAYLHLSESAAEELGGQVKAALALFGSTSPSYLILQSLDAANRYLADGYREKLKSFSERVAGFKRRLKEDGFVLRGSEPLKITIDAKKYGYTGIMLQEMLAERNLVVEFADPDFLVMMVTPETGHEGLNKLEEALDSVSPRHEIRILPPMMHVPERVMSIREAALSAGEIVPANRCEGRILAAATVGCPPAVPIVVCGERIDRHAVECFAYYGMKTCSVI
ncbi:MAG: PLP-dependent transferase [Clostridia bacterium]|nr:PLP-dependent transferase [Clostridia bacterium]